MANNDIIFLFTSNETSDYFLGSVEVLAMPSESIVHFRYQAKWIDAELKKKISTNEEDNKGLKNTKIIVFYLYQEKLNNIYKWKQIYSLRSASLVSVYKTGDSDQDIVHFYFKVENYIKHEQKNNIPFLENLLKKNFGLYYAFICNNYNNIFKIEADRKKTTFYTICKGINKHHFKYTSNEEFHPLFVYIEDIKDQKGKKIKVSYDALTHKSYYEFKEGKRYIFQLGTFLPESPTKYRVKLFSDKNIFSNFNEYELNITSRYNEEAWHIIPAYNGKHVWTLLKLSTVSENVNRLDFDAFFTTKINTSSAYQFFQIAGDIFLGLATAFLVASKVKDEFSWLAWLAIVSYALWIIFKGIQKLWKW